MSAFAQAKAMCEACGYDIEERLRHFREHGYVYISPTSVILAEEVSGFAWYVWLAVGANCLQQFISLAPYPLPHVVWARELRGRSTPKVYSFNRVQRLCKHFSYGRQTSEASSTPPTDAPSVSQ